MAQAREVERVKTERPWFGVVHVEKPRTELPNIKPGEVLPSISPLQRTDIKDIERNSTGNPAVDIKLWLEQNDAHNLTRDAHWTSFSKGLEKMEPADRERVLERIPVEVFEEFKRGLSLLDAMTPEGVKPEELAKKLGPLFEPNKLPHQEIIKYAAITNALTVLTEKGIYSNPNLAINAEPAKLAEPHKILENVRVYYKGRTKVDPPSVRLIEESVTAIAAAAPSKIAPKLKAEIIASTKGSDADIKICEIAINALKNAGDEGFNALLDIYSQTSFSWVKRAANNSLGLIELGFGNVVVYWKVRTALFNIINEPDNKKAEKQAFNFLREAFVAGKIKASTPELMSLYRKVAQSKDERIREIFEEAHSYMGEIAKANNTNVTTDMMLYGLVKAILKNSPYDLMAEGELGAAARAFKKLLGIEDDPAKIKMINFAFAFNLLGLGRIDEGVQYFKKGAEEVARLKEDMFKILGLVGNVGDEKSRPGMESDHEVLEIQKDASAALYTLGYVMVNKRAMSERRTRILLEVLMSKENKALWKSLKECLAENRMKDFTNMLDRLTATIKKTEDEKGRLVALTHEERNQAIRETIQMAVEDVMASYGLSELPS